MPEAEKGLNPFMPEEPVNRHCGCAPTRKAAEQLEPAGVAVAASARDRVRATGGSTDDMVRLDGGTFLMGSEEACASPADGEGPVRLVSVSPFWISPYAVTNREFRDFQRRTGYRTESERLGWSYVFRGDVSDVAKPEGRPYAAGTRWWIGVRGANWAHPEGPESSVSPCLNDPVVHVSWNDAAAYCCWAGYRLPTEAEWEYASRGGLEGKRYPWGDELIPGGEHRCNVWQGRFPEEDTGEDGYRGRAPAYSFPPNGFCLHNMTGNTWEWCADFFHPTWRGFAQPGVVLRNPLGPTSGTSRVMRGGSYLCHESYCWRFRCAARTGAAPDSGTGHIGFRVARDRRR